MEENFPGFEALVTELARLQTDSNSQLSETWAETLRQLRDRFYNEYDDVHDPSDDDDDDDPPEIEVESHWVDDHYPDSWHVDEDPEDDGGEVAFGEFDWYDTEDDEEVYDDHF